MGVSQRQDGDVSIIRVKGRLGVGKGSSSVWGAVLDAVEAGSRKIVLNLEEISRVDSAGVGELVACHTSVKNRGGQLKVAGLSPKLAQVLQITRLIGVLEAYDSEAEAVLAFGE